MFVCTLLIAAAVVPLAVSKTIEEPTKPHLLERLDQSQEQQTSWVPLWDELLWAQSFIPSLPKLTKISLYLYSYGHDGTTMMLSITDNIYGSEVLASASVSSDAVAPEGTWVWVDFDVQDIKGTPGETYYMVVTTTDDDLTGVLLWS